MPTPSTSDEAALERRLHRNRLVVLGLALLISLPLGSREMTIGIAIGGILGHFNQRWLSGSIKAILAVAASGGGSVPSGTVRRLFFRYALVGIGMGVALWLGVADPIGLAIGFSAYVGGVLIEAGSILFRVIRQGSREDESEGKSKNKSEVQSEDKSTDDLPPTTNGADRAGQRPEEIQPRDEEDSLHNH